MDWTVANWTTLGTAVGVVGTIFAVLLAVDQLTIGSRERRLIEFLSKEDVRLRLSSEQTHELLDIRDILLARIVARQLVPPWLTVGGLAVGAVLLVLPYSIGTGWVGRDWDWWIYLVALLVCAAGAIPGALVALVPHERAWIRDHFAEGSGWRNTAAAEAEAYIEGGLFGFSLSVAVLAWARTSVLVDLHTQPPTGTPSAPWFSLVALIASAGAIAGAVKIIAKAIPFRMLRSGRWDRT